MTVFALCPLNQAQLADDRLTLQIAVQRALLGVVTQDLLAVTAGINHERHISIVGYFRGDVGEIQNAEMEEVASEVVAAFEQPRRTNGEEIFATAEGVAFATMEHRPLHPLDFWAFVAKDAMPYLDHSGRRRPA